MIGGKNNLKRRGKKNTAPLRKVLGVVEAMSLDLCVILFFEELECGHIVRRKQDFIGATNAYRRRCKQCESGEDWHEEWTW